MIHEELAKKNGLSLNDKIRLDAGQSESGKGQTVEFEIVGIFSGKKQEKFTGMSSDFSEIMSLPTMKAVKVSWEIANLKSAQLVST